MEIRWEDRESSRQTATGIIFWRVTLLPSMLIGATMTPRVSPTGLDGKGSTGKLNLRKK